MQKNKKHRLKKINFLFLILAGILNATGVILFLVPSKVIDGGISGLSVFLSQITPVHISFFLVLLNLPLYLFGFKKLGLRFILYSLTAVFTYSLVSFLYQTVFGLENGIFSLIENDMLIAALFGGLISGLGSGITIRYGGAIDGVEVLAVLFAKKLTLTIGQFVMFFNIVLYSVASIATQNILVGFYSVISYAVGLKIVDFVVDGFDRGKACIIITKKAKPLAEVINRELGRGITVIESKGFYSNEKNVMLYCVVNRFEIVKLKTIIDENDPNAFVAINDISEVLGNKIKFTLKKKNKAAFNRYPTSDMENNYILDDEEITNPDELI